MNDIEKKQSSQSQISDTLKYFFKPNKDPNVVELEFDALSATYDDVLEASGYPLAREGARALSRYISFESKILDAGCGTGLVGENLAELGFRRVDGIDLSSKSLEVANSKDIYSSLKKHNLLSTLPFSDNTFDATICIAVFSRFNSEELSSILKEFSRVTLSGGYIAFSQRENLDNGVVIKELIETIPGLAIEYVTDPSQAAPLLEEHKDVLVRYFILKNSK